MSIDIRDEIKDIIEKSVKRLAKEFGGFEAPEISVDAPDSSRHGDYASNVALLLARQWKKNSLEIAEHIAESANRRKGLYIERIWAAPPGFVNISLTREFFAESVRAIAKNGGFGKVPDWKGQKVMVEYTDPNPFKEFHIGHLMSNAIGESLSRIFEFHSAKVKRACYQGDVGIHVAKVVWGKMNNPSLDWGRAYVEGSKAFNESVPAKQEITRLNKKIYEKSDPAVNALYSQGKKESMKRFEAIYQKLGTKFDYYFFESEIADFGKKIVMDGLKKGIFERGEHGAIIFKGEKFGLHTRVFISAEGLPTYEAKELGLAGVKHKVYRHDRSVIITGNEVNEYFKVLLCAMRQCFPGLAEKTRHIGHGMMRLAEGKMSSRAGNVITAELLLGEAEHIIAEKIRRRGFSSAERASIAREVAVGAVKYSILKQAIGSNIAYDPKKSISFEGDSGPYLQYAFARAQSVLKKAREEKIKAGFRHVPQEISMPEKLLPRFPEAVASAGSAHEPHHLVRYLTDLAGEFNNYYAKVKIADKEDMHSPYRIALVGAFSVVMKNGLWLLGIPAPERM